MYNANVFLLIRSGSLHGSNHPGVCLPLSPHYHPSTPYPHCCRMQACTQVLKSLVDRVEREERHEEKRLRKLESADEKLRHVAEQQQQQLLLRHKEQLKKDMLRKRALLEKALATHIQVGRSSTFSLFRIRFY